MLAWTQYADRMPTPEEQAAWLASYADGNIGLPLGPCSGLVAIDIDNDDPKVIEAIESVLPTSPWTRVGRKGKVLIFKWRDHQTARIRDANENALVEILSRGTQIVIPPSIHPTTQKPYWSNCELLEILTGVPLLPRDADTLIRGSLADAGIECSKRTKLNLTQFVPAGYRDNAMVATAGLHALRRVIGP
jgi:putative DNA primase/helicase